MLPSLDSSSELTTTFPNKLKGKWTILVLEEGTCCYRAGQYFAASAFEEKPTLMQASSFEEARKLAVAKQHILLLPHIHHITGDVETDYKWESMGDFIFRLDNPPLYLARSSSKTLSQESRCTSIERLKSLVDARDNHINSWLDVDTTQAAARMCANGRSEFCITNEYGVKQHGLEIVRELKKMEICWHPYQHAS